MDDVENRGGPHLTFVTNDLGYAAKRNYAGLPFEDISFERRYDVFKILKALDDRLPGRRIALQRSLETLYGYPFPSPEHLRNSVAIGPGPWVVTMEETLPFWSEFAPAWLKRLVWNRIASASCHAVIAISNHAQDRLRKDLAEADFSERGEVLKKTFVLYPVQKLLVSSLHEKPEGPPWRFVLVGTQFYRKGGAEAVRVFDRLLSDGAPIELHLVTELEQQPGSRTTPEWHNQSHSIIDRWDQINLHGRLPHEDVLALMRKSHVGLLPTYRDTFGISVLEAQAAGCPVITTNQCALPEINSEATGWMIDLPLDKYRNTPFDGKSKPGSLSERIEEGVHQSVLEIIETPNIILRKGRSALQRIQRRHNPRKAVVKLLEVYRAMQ